MIPPSKMRAKPNTRESRSSGLQAALIVECRHTNIKPVAALGFARPFIRPRPHDKA